MIRGGSEQWAKFMRGFCYIIDQSSYSDIWNRCCYNVIAVTHKEFLILDSRISDSRIKNSPFENQKIIVCHGKNF